MTTLDGIDVTKLTRKQLQKLCRHFGEVIDLRSRTHDELLSGLVAGGRSCMAELLALLRLSPAEIEAIAGDHTGQRFEQWAHKVACALMAAEEHKIGLLNHQNLFLASLADASRQEILRILDRRATPAPAEPIQ